jgi:hypothetical protein
MPEHNQGDEQEWDFDFVPDGPPEALVGSDGDLPLTDGEDDLRFLIDGELEAESEDDLLSWGNFSSSDVEEEEEDEEDHASFNAEGEEEDDTSSDEPPAKRLRGWAWSDDDEDDDYEEEEAPVEGYGSSDEELTGSSADGSYDGDDEASDGP